jgi:transketolase
VPVPKPSLEQRSIDTLRFLAADAVQEADSGHPGLPLGAAPMAFILWAKHLRYDPQDPGWPDRDRFVLSAGHGSALLYALLHLFGHALPLDEIRAFRQWGSRTPGHPESHLTPGVEVSTGPLGQGLANAVGLALAEQHLATVFNRPELEIVDHRTFVIASDGDLMEGVSYEACALAGHLRLGKLTVLFDANDISLAGGADLTVSEDVRGRFEAMGWHVQEIADGNDLEAIDAALNAAKQQAEKPSLIVVRTVIGFGSPSKAGTFKAHGSPLGDEELAATKEALGWPSTERFHVPEDVREAMAGIGRQGTERHRAWDRLMAAYRNDHPELADEFERRATGRLRDEWDADLPRFSTDDDPQATRKASEAVLQRLAVTVPELIGGSADLNPSTYTWLKEQGDFQPPNGPDERSQGAVGGPWDYTGRNIHFGVREHAMGAIAGGMAQHGGVLPYTATFLVFSDYMRPPIRLAALSGYPAIYVFTHDSIAVGEDGPTHQPVEQLMSLRLIPDLVVLRPADANETVHAWRLAVSRRDGPTALVFTRQKVPTLGQHEAIAEGVARGGYTLWASSPDPELLLIGTGSEVGLCLEAGARLAEEGTAVRVVSMPSLELFASQEPSYRDRVLPPAVRARVVVEAGRSLGWERYAGPQGEILGVDRFGASAPGERVYAAFGFTVENVCRLAREVLTRCVA